MCRNGTAESDPQITEINLAILPPLPLLAGILAMENTWGRQHEQTAFSKEPGICKIARLSSQLLDLSRTSDRYFVPSTANNFRDMSLSGPS